MPPETPFTTRVFGVVRRIPYGRVASYGDVAALLGSPRAARGVGHALSTLGDGGGIPWWRVVNARGEISLRAMGGRLQRALLEQEGVRFSAGRIDLRSFRWDPEAPHEPAPDMAKRARPPGGTSPLRRPR